MAAASLLATPDGTEPTRPDPLRVQVLGDLDRFAAWLRRNGVRGYIGEVGWPDRPSEDEEAWNTLADAWYAEADRAGLWVTAWATGRWFHADYPLAVYDATSDGLVPGAQAEVVERHGSRPGVLRGVVVAGGEFGTDRPGFSNATPGVYGSAYRYDPPETFTYLAGRGIELVRLPFRWERVQPRLGGELDTAEVDRIRRTVGSARAAGLSVVLDLHNFGEYRAQTGGLRLGAEIDESTFADTWRRLAIAFRGVPGVVGYGLMNEPAHLQPGRGATPERTWERFSQAAVTAIRRTGDRRIVFVGGYPWSSVHDWAARHPRAWIADPLGRIRYEAHHYWDADHSGRYGRAYAEERAAAEDARTSRTS